MVTTDSGPQTVFVAGYEDLTAREFAMHYQSRLDEAINNGHYFLLSDQAGACLITYEYLHSKDVPNSRISIYMSKEDGQIPQHLPIDLSVFSIKGGESERYAAMVERSNYDILWLRPKDMLDRHGCISAGDVLRMRFTGAMEAKRATHVTGIRAAMAYYDTIV